jgi:hypothetical protein
MISINNIFYFVHVKIIDDSSLPTIFLKTYNKFANFSAGFAIKKCN